VNHRGTLLRVFVGEEDRYERRPLYEALVDALQSRGFSGAIVLKGVEGFGSSRQVRSSRAIDRAADLTALIEVIDDEEKIVAFLPTLQGMMSSGLITLEAVDFRRALGGEAR
jgi:hypothetical protein